MFDIDKYLNDIHIKDVAPSDELITRVQSRCADISKKAKRRRRWTKTIRKSALIGVPAAVILLVGIFLGATFFGSKDTNAALAAAYYTVDINPSICVNVDQYDIVTGVDTINDDAKTLMADIDCVGKPAVDAIEQIITAADEAGYITGDAQYVLVGVFGRNETDETLADLQNQLEQNFGGMINLLIVSGSFEDKQKADTLHVSAGLLKLSQMADGVEITSSDKVKDVLEEVNEVNKDQFDAPVLEADTTADGIRLSWTELDFDAMGYTGKVTYHILAGDSYRVTAELEAEEINTYTFSSGSTQPISYIVYPTSGVLEGESKYFAIYAEYGDGVGKLGNIVCETMPAASPPTPAPTPQVTNDDEPTEADSLPVSGRVSGEYVKLSWDKETSSDFSGYKIVASKTNPNPAYLDDGYLKYITNRDTTSISLHEGYGGLKAGQYYYFSVTYLFKDGRRTAGNAVKLKVPEKQADAPAPTTAPTTQPNAPCVATTIGGSIEGTTVSLHWDAVSHSGLDGYKVMYSFTDTEPVYGDGSKYAKWITNPSTTSCALDVTSLSGYSAGAVCYFSITVLYDDHNVKKPGNVISFDMPEGEPEEPYVATTIGGSIDGTTVSLHWDAVSHSGLDGYKVMYSFTDTEPVYGDGSKYAQWITDASTTCCTLDAASLDGYAPGAVGYFSITVLYHDHSVKKPGNVITLNMPAE